MSYLFPKQGAAAFPWLLLLPFPHCFLRDETCKRTLVAGVFPQGLSAFAADPLPGVMLPHLHLAFPGLSCPPSSVGTSLCWGSQRAVAESPRSSAVC